FTLKQRAADGLTEGSSDTVGILQLEEFYCHALIVMAHDSTPQAPENGLGPDRRLDGAGDRGAAQRDIEDAAAVHVTVRQDELRSAVAWHDALVFPLLA